MERDKSPVRKDSAQLGLRFKGECKDETDLVDKINARVKLCGEQAKSLDQRGVFFRIVVGLELPTSHPAVAALPTAATFRPNGNDPKYKRLCLTIGTFGEYVPPMKGLEVALFGNLSRQYLWETMDAFLAAANSSGRMTALINIKNAVDEEHIRRGKLDQGCANIVAAMSALGVDLGIKPWRFFLEPRSALAAAAPPFLTERACLDYCASFMLPRMRNADKYHLYAELVADYLTNLGKDFKVV